MMKKILFVALLVMAMVSPSFAASTGIGADQTGTMTIGGGAKNDGTGDTDTLAMGLSSNVHGYYDTDGTSAAPAQWYVIGTYHLGGNNVYGTAQDITSLYKLADDDAKTPGELYTWGSGLPADSGDSNTWSGTVWEKL